MRRFVALAVGVACAAAALGIVGPPRAHAVEDSTAALQANFDALKPGDALTLDPGTYFHSGVIQIRVPGVRINGNGATLQATNDVTSSVQIKAAGVTVSNLRLTAPLGGPRYSAPEQHKLLVNADNATLSDITIDGSAASGVFVYAANNFKLDRITVRDSRADGIHFTDGASNGVVNNVVTERTGDDGVAVVSYTEQYTRENSGICRNIVINSPVVNGTTWGQGVTVRGGENITYRNIRVSQTAGAGVFVASEGAPFFARSSVGVTITGGTVTGANVNPAAVMGAIAVYGEHPGYRTANVTIADLTVVDTPQLARKNIAIQVKDGGAVDDIKLRNIAIRQQGDLAVFYSNAPREAFSATGITLNGTAYPLP